MNRGAAEYNAELIGVPGSLARLETPALVLRLEAFEANIGALAELSKASGIALRPHAKTHKCATIARRQLAAGALGIACAKPGELLALFEAGIHSLMLTAPVASPAKILKLAAAAAQGCRLTVVVDRPELVAAYGRAAREAGTRIDVLLDLDTGLGRAGISTGEQARAVAQAIRAEPGLAFRGVQAYAGQVQHVDRFEDRKKRNDTANERLRNVLAVLETAGLRAEIVTGGGTGSAALDAEDQLLTEIQAGSYVFMDEGYRQVQAEGGGSLFRFALFVAVTVINHDVAGAAITDGGTKSFAIDGPPPRAHTAGGELIGEISWAGDEFGRLKPLPGKTVPAIGTRLFCTVPHCDPTANLYDVLHVARGDMLAELWPIEARGRSD